VLLYFGWGIALGAAIAFNERSVSWLVGIAMIVLAILLLGLCLPFGRRLARQTKSPAGNPARLVRGIAFAMYPYIVLIFAPKGCEETCLSPAQCR